MMRTRDAEKYAKKIVDYLFNDGAQEAVSLVLRLKNGRDSGGWGKHSVMDVIVDMLTAKRPRRKGAKK